MTKEHAQHNAVLMDALHASNDAKGLQMRVSMWRSDAYNRRQSGLVRLERIQERAHDGLVKALAVITESKFVRLHYRALFKKEAADWIGKNVKVGESDHLYSTQAWKHHKHPMCSS